jgi:hypothetical protein
VWGRMGCARGEYVKKRDRFEDLNEDGRIIFKCMFKKSRLGVD